MNYGPQWEALLDEIDEFLEGQEDIRDGGDGPVPNKAMSLLTTLRYLRPTVARPEAGWQLSKDELEALIDYHDYNAAGAEATGYLEAVENHEKRAEELKAMREALPKEPHEPHPDKA